MTPNSSRRCGATTCGSRESSSSTSAASMTWSASWPSSARSRAPARRARRPPRRRVQGGADRRCGATGSGRRRHAGRRSPLCRHMAGREAATARPGGVARRARQIEWKHGACQALGLPHANQADIAKAWRQVRSRVRDWNDLEPALISRVEELIDFVTRRAGNTGRCRLPSRVFARVKLC